MYQTSVTSGTTNSYPIEIQDNGIVFFRIPAGVTVNISPSSSSVNINASGRTGARPAINLPAGATLVITGDGTINLTGGDAADGISGSLASTGGDGGGGAAPGIGGMGGTGGKGNWTSDDQKYGTTGTDMGKLYILGNVTVNTKKGKEGESKVGSWGGVVGGGDGGHAPDYAIGGGGRGGNSKDGESSASSSPYYGQTSDNGDIYIQSTATVTYQNDQDNADSPRPDVHSVPTNNSLELAGYEFNGYRVGETWVVDANGIFVEGGNQFDESISVLDEYWTKTITLDQQGGTGGSEEIEVVYGCSMKAATAPSKSGYTFMGYFTEPNGGGTQYYDADMGSTHNWDIATNQSTLYAYWMPNTYTVYLNMQGGADGTSQVTATFDSAMPSATAPTKTGYTFAGYYTEENGGGTKYYNADMSSAHNWDIDTNPSTLYAQWTINDYTLTYDVNGGNALSPDHKDVTYNTAYGTLPTPTKTGYSFDGWYTQANGGDAVSSSTIMGADNVTIHAHWIANTYTVNLDMQAGSAGTAQVTATFDSAMPSATAPTRTGYTFGGYYTEANGGGTQFYNADMSSAHNWDIDTNPSTLYAYWTANTYQVTYDANGGVINGNSTLTQGETYDATYSLPEYTPTLNNYEFLGWFTSAIPSQGDKVTTGTTVAITEAQTLYAHWSPISVEAYSAEAQLGGNYFRTFYDSQTAHILPTGVTAYKGRIEGNYFVLTEIVAKDDDDNNIIPKDVPVILRMLPNNDAGIAIPGDQYQIKTKQISLTTSESELTIDNTDNELIGSDVTIASAIANSYILSFGSHGLGFYEWSTHPLEAHKAYVIKAPSNPAKALIFRFENDVTGINDAIMDFKSKDSNMVIYNLNGIRLSKPQKGINIINGQKVWVK